MITADRKRSMPAPHAGMAPINFLAFRSLYLGIGTTIRQQVCGTLSDTILVALLWELPNPKKAKTKG